MVMMEGTNEMKTRMREEEGWKGVDSLIGDEVTGVSRSGESTYEHYLRGIRPYPLLSRAEEVELSRRVAEGDIEARERMIRGNLRLVVKIARSYRNMGVALMDLINEGNIGLMRAVELFDGSRGVKFSSYASHSIKQSIRRCLCRQAKTIRLPMHVVERVRHVEAAEGRLRTELNREPSAAELAEATGYAEAYVGYLKGNLPQSISLDEPVAEGEGAELSEKVADEKAMDPAAQLELQTTLTLLNQFLGDLDERDYRILVHRFGLEGREEATLEDIGRELGVTRERIRQLQNGALEKLRSMFVEADRSNSPINLPLPASPAGRVARGGKKGIRP